MKYENSPWYVEGWVTPEYFVSQYRTQVETHGYVLMLERGGNAPLEHINTIDAILPLAESQAMAGSLNKALWYIRTYEIWTEPLPHPVRSKEYDNTLKSWP